jgi:hypothetical protein
VDSASSSPTYVAHDEEIDEKVQLPSQIAHYQWLSASRIPHSPKKPKDTELMARLADIRQQSNDSAEGSTGSTPRVSMILRASVASSVFSQSLCGSIASSPPVVDFSPTPVFKDEIPERFMEQLSASLDRTTATRRR